MRHSLCLALGFAFLFGAAAQAQPTPPRDADYFPLNKGAKWTYKVGDSEVVVSVAGTERVKSEDGVRVETHVGRDTKATECYAVRADGVYRTKVKDDVLDPAVTFLALPVKAGSSWPVDSKIGAQVVKGTFVIKEDRERVKVPAGEFDTVFMEGADFDIAGAKTTIRVWFARGRGIVKEEFVLPGGGRLVMELAKFEPGEVPPPVSPPTTEPPAPPTEFPPPPVCAWAYPPPCRILTPQCRILTVTTQESCGCCARPGRFLVRRR
jgi:hypothetical protein